jgi:hypothetical protein
MTPAAPRRGPGGAVGLVVGACGALVGLGVGRLVQERYIEGYRADEAAAVEREAAELAAELRRQAAASAQGSAKP